MGALLAVTGLALLLTLEYLPDVASRVLYCCLSLSCLLISASTTYGLGGFLIFVKGEKRSDTMWQFFQPLKGGPAFVATQVRAANVAAGCLTGSGRQSLQPADWRSLRLKCEVPARDMLASGQDERLPALLSLCLASEAPGSTACGQMP
jgi:hypothetical protein